MSGLGNTSTAVMASRVSPASSLNFFPTPPWATLHIPPGMALRYTRPADAALASPGEARRRRLAREAT